MSNIIAKPRSSAARWLLVLGLAWAQPAAAQDFTVVFKPNDGWWIFTADLIGRGEISLVLRPVARQGRVGICGFVLPQPGRNAVVQFIYDTIQNTRIRLGPTELIPDPDHFPVVHLAPGAAIPAVTAGCTQTHVPATAEIMQKPLITEARRGFLVD